MCATDSRQYHQLFFNFFTGTYECMNVEGEWEAAILEVLYPSLHENVTGGKFKLFD